MSKKTNSNIELKKFYGKTERPGEYPYTHGIYPNMYADRLWTMSYFYDWEDFEPSGQSKSYKFFQTRPGLWSAATIRSKFPI